ncbi:hypothetical protein HYZ97_01825 [Candidatus Pacearchaeota archaeon]|nr:hypothetical protein [Candidatus Pacearchaeota archaeon]
MRITITQEDIENGQRYSGWNCPIAHAFRREWSSQRVFVGAAICLDNDLSIQLPRSILSWRARYDRGEAVQSTEMVFSAEMIYRRVL